MVKIIRKILIMSIISFICIYLAAEDSELVSSERAQTPDIYTNFKIKADSVSYVADSIYYDVKSDQILFRSNATVKYKNSIVKSEEILIDLANDQAKTVGDTWMQEGSQKLYGNGVIYNIESEKGLIHGGASQFDKGYYNGSEIRKISDDVYDIDDGYFTTCDNKEPHFYINSAKMRLYYRDKVVAKPVIFYVNHFPVFFLPFGTFSIKTERARGFLVPEPGYNKVDGKYIENIAFYSYIDDYVEALTALDWREKTGWEARLESNYLRRYYYNGRLLARFQNRTETSSTTRKEWYLNARHHQDFLDQSSLDANLEFMSSKTIWQSSDNIDERLNETVTSSIAYRKQVFSTTVSSGANYTENLSDKTKQIVLPTVSFSLPSKPIYELFSQKDNSSTAWWRNISYSYSFRGVHSGTINDPEATLSDIIYKNKMGSDKRYINQHNAGIRHSAGLSYNHNIFGWLNFSQSVSGNEVWFDRGKDKEHFVRGNDYSASTRLSASVYGIGNYQNSPISAVRHVMTPSVSFNYTPDFSENEKFYSFSGIGLNSGKKRRNMAFNLDHKWSAKVYINKTKQTKALNDFFNFGSSLSYDLEKEKKPFSDLSHSLSFRPGSMNVGKLSVNYSNSGSIRQDAYDFEVKNWRVDNSLILSSNASYREYFVQEKNVFLQGSSQKKDIIKFDNDSSDDLFQEVSSSRQSFPWSLSVNHDYSKSKGNNHYSSNLRASLSFRLTRNWLFDYSNYYNLEKNELISQSLSLDRNLDCWKIKFSWTKQGDYWNYKVQLFNIKLPDSLKLRHSDYKRN